MKANIIGRVLDNYRIVQNIGRGGMGFVFKALNIKLNKIVALKMINPALAMNENFMHRFEAEAKTLAKLENPNIVRIYDLRVESDYCYIVMEYVEGITMGRLIKEKGAIPWPQAFKLFKQMLSAIEHAHKEEIIHRDIKPNNILITRQGLVKITDFGLAKNMAEFGVTQSATTGGTLFYMSPEQVKGLVYTDKRSDVYALGFTFYEMLTGKTPFEPEHTDFDIREAIIRKKFPPPHQLNNKIPLRLSRIVEKAIEKNPDDRFQSVSEFTKALLEFEKNEEAKRKKAEAAKRAEKAEIEQPVVEQAEPVGQKIEPVMEKKTTWFGRKSVAAVATLAGILVIAYFFFLQKPSDPFAETLPAATLAITSIPNRAMVFVNEDSVGQTPLDKIAVKEGTVSVEIRKENYFARDTSFSVAKDGNSKVHLQLQPAALVSFQIEPVDALLEINGQKIANRHWAGLPLTVGQHQLRLTHPQYQDTLRLNVEAIQGLNETIQLALNAPLESAQKDFGELTVRSLPVGASIYIDGKYVNRTPFTMKNLSAGNYELSLRMEGFVDSSEPVRIESNQTLTLEKMLVPRSGTLVITSNPPGAAVWIDIREWNMLTPCTVPDLESGMQEIVLRKEGYADHKTTVEIRANETIALNEELIPLLGLLTIHAVPWGTIFVNDKLINRDTNIKQQLELAVGEHRVRVEHPTFGIYEKAVQVENKKITQLNVDFNKTHKVKVTAIDAQGGPIWADILIDGRPIGDQTPKELQLRTGTYTISVARNGYTLEDGPRQVVIDDSVNDPLQFVLRKMNQ
jgi:hypothetical protein